MRPWFFALSALLLASSAAADTLYVNAIGVSPFDEIQEAIDAAVDGDQILVFPGTYGPIDFGGKDLVIRSTGGPTLTTIDASTTGLPAARLAMEEPPTALLHGFTLTGGTGVADDTLTVSVGGGVYVGRQSEARISGNVITGNAADTGAGIGVVAAGPHIYGNVVRENTGATGAGGVLVFSPAGETLETSLSCNDVRANIGGTVGGVLIDGLAAVRNNVVHGNTGDRGGVFLALAADGVFENNTITANESDPGNAAGVQVAGPDMPAVGNLVAYNQVGVGVVHNQAAPAWTFGNLWDNAAGAWSGGSADPTGADGNLAIQPTFAVYTPTDPLDDVLSLALGDPLLDAGSSDPAFLDVDGTTGAIGADGGPKLSCDADGDGVRVSDTPTDCIPDEGGFFPGAYELPDGFDHDCDGFGTLELFEFVSDDGGLTAAAGSWEFDEPVAGPGIGWQGISAWCTDCASGAGTNDDAQLVLTADLTAVPASTSARLLMIHAYEADAMSGGAVQVFDGVSWSTVVPDGGYPVASLPTFPDGGGASGVFGGDSLGYRSDAVDLTSEAGATTDLRFRYVSGPASSTAGWTIGRLALQIGDGDGDGRAAVLTDCDDTDATIHEGAPEVPYDGVDQDCDGADLLDVDGDGFDAAIAGGDDCDDTDADTNPNGTEIPYDEIDQDCAGGDLVDVDGDGAASWEAGGPDCDDADPDIGPNADEIPYDGIDQDCSGDDLVDVDGDGFRGDVPAPFGDCDDGNAAVNPDADEICDDGIDNDCNELLDEELDFDGDGYDRCAGDCDESASTVHPGQEEACTGVDDDCDGTLLDGEVDADLDGELLCAGDCNDDNATIGLTAPEVCDGRDNDCDLGVDEGLDGDGDGFSRCTVDCDDQRSTVYPGAPLGCDDNLDHDCNGIRDFEEEECAETTGCSATGRSGAPWVAVLFLVPLAARRRSLRS